MISFDSLMEMILTDSLEGGDRAGCRDFGHFIEGGVQMPERLSRGNYRDYLAKLPNGESRHLRAYDFGGPAEETMIYSLELVELPDGSLEWRR
jgi:hypothetical protein